MREFLSFQTVTMADNHVCKIYGPFPLMRATDEDFLFAEFDAFFIGAQLNRRRNSVSWSLPAPPPPTHNSKVTLEF